MVGSNSEQRYSTSAWEMVPGQVHSNPTVHFPHVCITITPTVTVKGGWLTAFRCDCVPAIVDWFLDSDSCGHDSYSGRVFSIPI